MTAEPEILSGNIWHPSASTDGRRSNEVRHRAAVLQWLLSLGMVATVTPYGSVVAHLGAIRAEFSYTESASHVYKHLHVTVAGQKSTIRTLRALADPKTRTGTLARATRLAGRDGR